MRHILFCMFLYLDLLMKKIYILHQRMNVDEEDET